MQGAKSILYSPNPVNVRAASRVVSSSRHLAVLHQVVESAVPPMVRSTSPSSPSGFFLRAEEASGVNLKASSRGVLETVFDDAVTSVDVQPSRSSQNDLLGLADVTIPSTPILLLEGDQYCIGRDGVARTLYRLETMDGTSSHRGYSVEEHYDISNAKKRYLLRQNSNFWDSSETKLETSSHRDTVRLGHSMREVDLQEIPAGVFDSAGTGSTTWESSLVMSMYFASHPELLQGNVVELGSGVGLGGILCSMVPWIYGDVFGSSNSFRSLTLTDFNQLVLDQCRKNVKATAHGPTPISVAKLDWYDFLLSNFERPSVAEKYDTIIACDCAYRHRDIAALASTMRSLLRDEHSRIHIFGPSNRSGLDELLTLLRSEHQLSVTVEVLKMERYRLRPMPDGDISHVGGHFAENDMEWPYATSSLSSFLHIVCSLASIDQHLNAKLSDID